MKKALLIIDHGSKRAAANEMLFEMVALVKKERPDLIIHGAHMELEDPSIQMGIEACIRDGATEIIAHPFMLSPGRHAIEDIPDLVAQAIEKHPGVTARVTAPLGLDETLARLILKRAAL